MVTLQGVHLRPSDEVRNALRGIYGLNTQKLKWLYAKVGMTPTVLVKDLDAPRFRRLVRAARRIGALGVELKAQI